ncbi:MAG: hypothetical protein ACKOYN_11195 [Planctomycetota bacterium]
MSRPISRPSWLLPFGACAALGAFACAAPAMAAQATAVQANGSPEARAMTIATAAAQVTGLAVSPLLVLVAIGLGDFLELGGFDAAPGTLPLHANPWLLGPCAFVLLLLGLKKFAAPAIPLPLRKLLDAGEYFEAKLSALLAAGVLLPAIASSVAAATGAGADAGPAPASAMLGFHGATALSAAAVVCLFGCVWVMFHMVEALTVLSPFAVVDAVLVVARLLVLAAIGLALLISPYLACALCLPIIVAACLVAGWCIRLDLFVLSVAGDLLFRRNGARSAASGRLRAFLASRAHGAPIRTMGHLEPAPGGMVFTYRPFFAMPARRIAIASTRTGIVRGLLWSTMRDDAARRPIAALPPRYQAHHAEIARRFAAETRDGALRRGLRGFREVFLAITTTGDAPVESAAEPASRP